jgi:hypothetical protein
MSEPTDLDSQLAKLEEEKAKREAKREEKAKLRKLEALQLEAKYSEELGEKGVKFDIHSTDVGNFVLKLAEFISHKRFNAKSGNGLAEEDVFAFVVPSVVFPDRDTTTRLFREHVQIAWRCAALLQAMSAAEGDAKAGK